MAWMITATVFLSVLIAALCFNIDPVAWRTLGNQYHHSFGYQIVQRSSDLLVSAPLEQNSPTERGQIYNCNTISCSPLSVREYATNMSLGLTMSHDPSTQKTLVCGPTISKDCKVITMYYGACLEILSNNDVRGPVPSTAKECPSQADIAFLLDGSGSVFFEDFQKMKKFVEKMITAFKGKDTKFAIAQFSSNFRIHTYLTTFNTQTLQQQIKQIKQLRGGTYTPTSINQVVDGIFVESRGARTGAAKILIVITDGESNDPNNDWAAAINAAERKKIIRFAIGVGSAFSSAAAKQELNRIASYPSKDHVFEVESFTALDKIEASLQAKIFSIEGSQSSGENLKRELSQSGFSAVYSPQIHMSIVGANDWTGGFDRYSTSYQLTNSYELTSLEKNSYLGYSMAVAKTRDGILTIAGAPRYKHRGAVMAVQENNSHQKIDPFPWQFQSGEYFGAEVCAMNLDRDAYTDLILISAPMYVDDDREGRVYVCRLSGLQVDCHFDAAPMVLRGAASSAGRFGSSLAVVPDLNRDGFNDLAVGAPLEDDRKGSIYIFHGTEGDRGINPVYSQRIIGSEVQSGLKFFGISISQSSFDQSGDRLVDLAVGAEGKVVLLRSQPIVMVETSVTYSPSQVSTNDSNGCSVPKSNKATVCFTMSRQSQVDTAEAKIDFTLTLDANRKIPNNRAYIKEKVRDVTESIQLDLTARVCRTIKFFVEACPVDILNEIPNQVTFTFKGLSGIAGLSPSLAQQAQKTSVHPLQFENYCGKDKNCVDNLKVDLNFTGSSLVKVGIDDVTDVTVSVRNHGENSYNTHVILSYPAGLSFRKITVLHGRIVCSSQDSEDGSSRGKTDCSIDQPIFRRNSLAVVIISYGIPTNSQLKNQIFFTANATSGNMEHSEESRPYQMKTIDVKYGIFAAIESTPGYENFSFGQNDLQKPAQQLIRVVNDFRPVNYTVIINIPVMLGLKEIWVNSTHFQIPDCRREKDTKPTVSGFAAQIRKNKTVDCSVASCAVFKCRVFLPRQQRKEFNISTILRSGWIEQIGLESASFTLTSTATLDYDRTQYIFQSADSSPPVRKVEMEVEVYLERQFLKEIVGGSMGGLLLLALISAGLYKAGFFKSKLNTMMDEGAGEAGSPAGDGDAALPE